jgi:hypothetical protein
MSGLAGHVACMGGLRNYILCWSEEINERVYSTQIIVPNSMEEISLES